MRNATRPFIHAGVTPSREPRAPYTSVTLIGLGPMGAGPDVPLGKASRRSLPERASASVSRPWFRARSAPWRAAEEAFRAYLERCRVDDRAEDAAEDAARLPWPSRALPASPPSVPPAPVMPSPTIWAETRLHWGLGVVLTLALAAGIVIAYCVSMPLVGPAVSGALAPAPRCR